MFNSIPLTGNVIGTAGCKPTKLVPAIGTTPIPPQYNMKTQFSPPDYVKIISATDGQG
jgi:hypothetical protein